MEKKNQIQETISLIMKYNRQMYEYGKDFRSYGTDKMLRVDQMSIINLIGDNPKCNLKLIAQSTDSNISTVSLQVARLVKLGLLEKHRSSMNQREIVLSLSGEGMKAYEFHKKLDQNWSDTVESLLSGYPKEELAVINAFLHQLLTENPPM
ncbi:MarR family winged helix-turn-helix transcriptional regulator [Enterocloster bolteae]|uniref:MarR family winged helix-turn-helix transcriptional regulator n=1 Tax=Enterocloster bolteae TaxID=208479 RepID=UPI002A7F0F82|nr:MarR family winged helix-turn-helix transcriptional regulator [Enterocloster bolteae]